MRLRTAALAPALLLLAACGNSDADQPEPTTSTETTETEGGTELNSRGAVEVQLGDTATITRPDGTLVLEVSDTSLSTDGCKTNTNDPAAITKQAFAATIEVGDATVTQWLWQSDFYYVDRDGRVIRNTATSDAERCSGLGTDSFINLPENSSAEGRVTLDVPNTAEVIGYNTKQSGQNIHVEWVLPDTVTPTVASATEQAPVAEPAPSLEQTQTEVPQTQPTTAPPVGYTGAPIGDPQPLVGKTIAECLTGPMYQTGTTQFTDGTTGWTQECAGG